MLVVWPVGVHGGVDLFVVVLVSGIGVVLVVSIRVVLVPVWGVRRIICSRSRVCLFIFGTGGVSVFVILTGVVLVLVWRVHRLSGWRSCTCSAVCRCA